MPEAWGIEDGRVSGSLAYLAFFEDFVPVAPANDQYVICYAFLYMPEDSGDSGD
ncbi:hypothetical protein ACFSJ3_11970 [Corallincola platygyrae]|uniref:Uncharacterized protein n=1 Tax=Corallincola platygyrae TaxID=1193278 RepID=A0ABW4XPB3_9GAMM